MSGKSDSKPMKNEEIAKVCHEANRAYCQAIGDNTQVAWEVAEAWQRESAVAQVSFCINNPNASVSVNHDAWLKTKKDDGWVFGPVKDASKKEHPCIVPYEELPLEQRRKDALFKAVVGALWTDPDASKE